jgi:hypothetical protein
MTRTDDPMHGKSPAFPRRTTDVVRAHWKNLRRGHFLPSRDAIDPRKINGVLDQVVLIERRPTGKSSFRVSGMALNSIIGTELRGLPFEDIFVLTARQQAARSMEALFDQPAILSMQLSADVGLAHPSLLARMVLFPLHGPGGNCDLAIGGIDLKGATGTAPRRFQIDRTLREPLFIAASHQPAARSGRPNLVLLDFDHHPRA